MLKSVVEGKSKSMKKVLRNRNGETIKITFFRFHHDYTRLVNYQVSSDIQSVEMLERGEIPSCLASLGLLTRVDEGHQLGMNSIILLLVEPCPELQEGDVGLVHHDLVFSLVIN